MGEKTEPYRPSNGMEGEIFTEHFCANCQRDSGYSDDQPELGCQILANSFAFDITDPEYPKEWVRDVDADISLIGAPGARCTAFVEIGKEIPYRCPNTPDMFDNNPRLP